MSPHLNYDMAISLWQWGSGMWWFKQEWCLTLIALNAWWLSSGAIWQRIGGMALLEEMSCWGWVLGFQIHKSGPPSLSLSLPFPLSLSLPAACHSGCRTLSYHSSTMSICLLPWLPPWQKWINPVNTSKHQLNAFFHKCCHDQGISS